MDHRIDPKFIRNHSPPPLPPQPPSRDRDPRNKWFSGKRPRPSAPPVPSHAYDNHHWFRNNGNVSSWSTSRLLLDGNNNNLKGSEPDVKRARPIGDGKPVVSNQTKTIPLERIPEPSATTIPVINLSSDDDDEEDGDDDAAAEWMSEQEEEVDLEQLGVVLRSDINVPLTAMPRPPRPSRWARARSPEIVPPNRKLPNGRGGSTRRLSPPRSSYERKRSRSRSRSRSNTRQGRLSPPPHPPTHPLPSKTSTFPLDELLPPERVTPSLAQDEPPSGPSQVPRKAMQTTIITPVLDHKDHDDQDDEDGFELPKRYRNCPLGPPHPTNNFPYVPTQNEVDETNRRMLMNRQRGEANARELEHKAKTSGHVPPPSPCFIVASSFNPGLSAMVVQTASKLGNDLFPCLPRF